MQLLSEKLTNHLEYEIINFLLFNPELVEVCQLKVENFHLSKSRIIFERILELSEKGQKVDLVSVSQGLDKVSEYLDLLSITEKKINIQTTLDFYNAVDQLKENYMRRTITEKVKDSTDSNEFLKFAKEAEELSRKIIINPLEQDFQEFVELSDKRKNLDDTSPVTSWNNFNELIRLERGNFVIIGARPSIGKTAFCLSLALDTALLNSKVLFVSLEMSKQQLFYRLLSNVTKVNSKTYQQGNADLISAKEALVPLIKHQKLQLLFKPKLLSSDLRQFKGYDMIIVDYLQLLSDESRENENIRIQNISRNLKILAGENNCVVVAAAQLNRDSEKAKRKPNLSDLRSSGSLEQDADIACLLHREDRKSTDMEIIIAKNRNGEVGELMFDYFPNINKFLPLT